MNILKIYHLKILLIKILIQIKKLILYKISITEKFGEAGITVKGYSLELNINYFLKAIGKLVKLPNLLFDFNKNHKFKGFYIF